MSSFRIQVSFWSPLQFAVGGLINDPYLIGSPVAPAGTTGITSSSRLGPEGSSEEGSCCLPAKVEDAGRKGGWGRGGTCLLPRVSCSRRSLPSSVVATREHRISFLSPRALGLPLALWCLRPRSLHCETENLSTSVSHSEEQRPCKHSRSLEPGKRLAIVPSKSLFFPPRQ